MHRVLVCIKRIYPMHGKRLASCSALCTLGHDQPISVYYIGVQHLLHPPSARQVDQGGKLATELTVNMIQPDPIRLNVIMNPILTLIERSTCIAVRGKPSTIKPAPSAWSGSKITSRRASPTCNPRQTRFGRSFPQLMRQEQLVPGSALRHQN